MKFNLILAATLSIFISSQSSAWISYSYGARCNSTSVSATVGVACAPADGCETKLILLKLKGQPQDLKSFTISYDTAETYNPAGLILAANKADNTSVSLIFDGYSVNEKGTVIYKTETLKYGKYPSSEIVGKTEAMICEQGPLTTSEYESMSK